MKKNWYSITNKSEAEAEVCIYDEIGMWGITARDFLSELKSVGNRKIVLRINSPGGEVFDGIAIYNRLSEHAPGVEVRIDGIAASMASVIAMVGAPVKMAENALLMIHNPSGICMGDADDMRDLADMLDKVRGNLIGAYEKKTGKSSDEILAMMDAETWLNASEAEEAGFVDEITEPMKMAASIGKLKIGDKLQEREKSSLIAENSFDKDEKNRKSAKQMSEPTSPVIVAEPSAPAVPPVAPAQIVDVAALKSEGAKEERQRVADISAWAGEVAKIQNLDLSGAVNEFIENGKSLADFKEHVITNTFKAKTVAVPTDTTGAQGNTMKREDFEKLSPFNQSDFCRKGGKLTD